MSSGVVTTKPTTTTYDWGALVREAWGDAWLQREYVYQMSNGRKFYDSGSAGGPYTGTNTGT